MIVENKLGRVVSIICVLAAITILAPSVVAKEQHWAFGSVKALVDLGIGAEPEPGLADISTARLDEAISPLEWQMWVRQAVALEIGMDWAKDEYLSFWVDAYTVPEHEGPRSVLTRGYAVGGLMKIGNLLGFIPGGGQGPLVHLPRFSDWQKLEARGLEAPWELMLAAGVVNGYPDGTLRPEAPLTRAEAACLLKAWLEVSAGLIVSAQPLGFVPAA